jgi:hypothetical protein
MADATDRLATSGEDLQNWRLRELERRVGRIEAFLLGILCAIALAVMGGVFALLNLPTGGI